MFNFRQPGHLIACSLLIDILNIENCLGMSEVNLFIYQARESNLVPAGFLTARFLQKLCIYEAFDVEGKLGLGLHGGKGKCRQLHPAFFQASLHLPVSPGKQ